MEKTATEIARTEPRTDADDDRLSSLPDEIISHILSSLQTKYALGTAVLSRRWKELWARVSNLDLDNTLFYKPLDMQIFLRSLPPVEQRNFQGRKLFAEILGRRELEFCRFADKVLRQHKNLDSVRRFRFRCSVYFRESRLSPDSLFETELVFGPLLEEIDVLICGKTEFGFPQCMRCIPESFYTLKNLKVAKLQGVVLGTIEQPVSLPSLKILQLKDVLMNDVKSLGRLISGCTVLETAHLERCSPPNMKLMDTIEACSPYLKNLKIMSESACHDPVCPIVIEAPNLEHLHLGRFADLKFKGSGQLSCLHSADVALECCSSWNHAEFALLTQISTAKKIGISAGNLLYLSHVNAVQLLVFPNLTHLTIGTGGRSLVIHSFLSSAPKLQSLVFDMSSGRGSIMWDRLETARTPECLLTSLEEIEMKGLVVHEDYWKMHEYFD